MKTIKVVAAVIKKENEIFATARGYGDFKDKWLPADAILIYKIKRLLD